MYSLRHFTPESHLLTFRFSFTLIFVNTPPASGTVRLLYTCFPFTFLRMEKLLPSTTPKPDPLKALLQGMANSFARAYGIQAETAQGLLLAVFFVVVIAVVWPIALRYGMDGAAPFSTDARIENATPAVSSLHEQLATLANENFTLRSALERIAVRLEANERHCAELQAKLDSRSSKKED